MQPSIIVLPGNLTGPVRVPLSKSLLHRSLICAAMAGDLTLSDLGSGVLSDDINTTKECLSTIISARVELGHGRVFSSDDPVTFSCRESGSTLRFLVPLVAVLGIPSYIVGEGRLPMRPLREYLSIFDGKDVSLDFPDKDLFLPLRVSGRLKPGTFKVPGHISSQYISGLLMALPLLEASSDILLTTPLESEPYVEMTRDVMRSFCVEVEKTAGGYHIPGGQSYRRTEAYRAEPDFSQAAFWIVAEYLGNSVSVLDLPVHSSQGDREICSLIERLKEASLAASGGDDVTVEVDVSQIPDLVPVFAVAAAATHCVTRITHAHRLRIKECDRLAATHDLLSRLGIAVVETDDGLIISGRLNIPGEPLFKACDVDSYHDHRMVMAAAIAATRANGPICISDYHAVNKSYPDFFQNFRNAGGIADELDVGK